MVLAFEISLEQLFGFLDDALDGGAFFRLGGFTDQLEDLLETVDMGLGFRQMILESLFQRRCAGFLGHDRQLFDQQVFGKIDVLERVDEQVL